MKVPGKNWLFECMRVVAAVFFITAGLNHFRSFGFYERIVPPMLPWPGVIVAVSGVAEMIGGLGLLICRLRRAASWGLIALLVAVFPANLYMALEPERFADLHLSEWILWARLPVQAVLIAWVWVIGGHKWK